jgi:hypothetical protein
MGVLIDAVIDPAPPHSPLWHIVDAVKRKRLAGLSVGAVFERIGKTIVKCRPVEWSLTATPVGGRHATFEVLAAKAARLPSGKSLNTYGDVVDTADVELQRIGAQLDRMAVDVAAIRAHRLREAVR